MTYDADIHEHRKASAPVHELILSRWSPRALSGEELSDDELASLFEAARWAPSSYNGQPWRFLFAKRGGRHWDTFFGLLGEFNQDWAKGAAALIVVLSRKGFEHNDKPARTHSFDAGSAWQNLALQATSMGIVSHAMQGFDYDEAREKLGVPDVYEVEAMIAVGRHGEKEELPEGMQEREKPSGRKERGEIAWEGAFGDGPEE